jgi:hypothetical protein
MQTRPLPRDAAKKAIFAWQSGIQKGGRRGTQSERPAGNFKIPLRTGGVKVQEQVNERTVALSIKGAKLTGRLLAKAMQTFLKRARASPKTKTVAQSVKSLTKSGASLQDAEITGDNIGSFKRVARKYSVGFALKKDVSETPPKWIVFFKSKDGAAMESAFREYGRIQMKVKERPSMLDKLHKFRELAKQAAAPAKNRNRGERGI